jgi:two-component system chemotaxis sensor kinase CheA
MQSKFQIVAVDDQEEILDTFKLFFDEEKFELLTFTSPIDALNYIKINHKQILLILSDFKMPELTGFDLKKELNILNIEIPFILATGYFDKEMASIGMRLGISYFLEKPFASYELPQSIFESIDKRKTVLNEEISMLVSFIEESTPMLDEIEELILRLEIEPQNETHLNTYYRLLHTIKGTASCVGLISIPSFVHEYENLVGRLKSKEISVNQEIINILLHGLDIVKMLYSEAKKGIVDTDIKQESKIFSFTAMKRNDDNITPQAVTTKTNTSSEIEKKEDKLSVDISLLDSFMELSGELTVLRNTIVKSAQLLNEKLNGDKDLNILTDALEEMHKVSSSLQNDISEMRKIQVETVFRPLKRVIRDSSKSLKKDIYLKTSGEELKIDTSTGKILSNALVHMIRNSIDHGIENKEKREKAGKKAQGKIELSLREEGEFIVVDLKDDGHGLDIGRIKQKAIEKGLYTEDQLKYLTEQKIFAIIFESGFSTAQTVTDISGRGVGMDMVRSSVESAGGRIIINSKLGLGSHFTIILPIPRSVLIIKSLMVSINNGTYSIPMDDVREVVKINEDDKQNSLQHIRGAHFLKHHEELIPLVLLGNYFNKKVSSENEFIERVVLIKSNGHHYGIVVNEIFDIEEIVAKKLSKELSKNKLFKGVTFIGDRDLALILDLDGIAELHSLNSINNENDDRFVKNVDKSFISDTNEFIQFNLKNKKNFAIPLNYVNRLENIETSKIEYSGDVALVQYRDSVLPLILTEKRLHLISGETSIEHFYKDVVSVIVVSMGSRIYGLIVDEISDIAKSNEKIETELSDRNEILGTIFINDKTVSILNVESITTDDIIKQYEQHKSAA